jgi:aryl-alcohol dehydrogenase-like predicted oxidoreductase
MDLKKRVPLGRTGVMVSRMGLAQGYGVPAASIEKAFHEYGINYFYVSPIMNLGKMKKAMRNLASSHRDDLMIVLARMYFGGGFGGFRLERYVEGWLKRFRIDRIDLLFQGVNKPLTQKVIDTVQRLKNDGKVRFVGMSSHERPFLGAFVRGEVKTPVDFIHIRYNAVHTGAEQDIFPHLPHENRPGIGVYTATCWRKLLKPRLLPAGERPLTATDCYRFVLSNPDVNVCITAPSKAEQMEENLKALDAGPLDEEQMARIRRIGKHIHKTSRKTLME